MGAAALVYGIVSYVVFLISLLYSIGFVGNLIVPKTIDSGLAGPASEALLVDVLLLLAFAIPHSVMARAGFKRWWTPLPGRACWSFPRWCTSSGMRCRSTTKWKTVRESSCCGSGRVSCAG
mgnify:CR=1 FL=1